MNLKYIFLNGKKMKTRLATMRGNAEDFFCDQLTNFSCQKGGGGSQKSVN